MSFDNESKGSHKRSVKSSLAVFVMGAVLWAPGFTNSVSAQAFPTSRPGNIIIGNDKNITWEGPENSTVYCQIDYEAPRPFAVGRSGVQSVFWMMPGHLYVFTLRDINGNEIARAQKNLRPSNGRYIPK
jgi:hypothetical protein